jgi:hypothetical protein
MEQTESLTLLLKFVAVLALLTLLHPSMRGSWIKAMYDFINNFRGGPPTAMHPSPADDAALLLKRRSKTPGC